ncbi:uncharacterized protein UV8b_05168 [Ustilaginoidea virens]|uniref:Secreted protein n=1 Tax=Ustilaginoidea virens TaxID=1159556 RepID=A0A8E5MID5_USTVR|nr:uncharacterized protein UV8b_05168 [Ustilaginoidea virens]QUC20927.1 hypothetical protein UV8b_05168 [Ustilaginoidea virens]
MISSALPLAAVIGSLAVGSVHALPANANAHAAAPAKATLGKMLWIDGVPVERAPANEVVGRGLFQRASPCSASEEVLVCAKRIAQKFVNNVSADQELPRKQLVWRTNPKYHSRMGWSDMTLDYTPVFGSCKLSEPVVVSQGELFACSVQGGCSQTFIQSKTTTQTENYGYKVGTSVTTSGTIGLVSLSVGVSSEWNQGWSSTNQVQTTSQRTYNLANGEVCAPTTVQIQMDCIGDFKDAQLTFHTNKAKDPVQTQSLRSWCDSGKSNPQQMTDWQKWTGQDFNVLCNSVYNSRVPRKMFLGSGALDNSPWTVQGCSMGS